MYGVLAVFSVFYIDTKILKYLIYPWYPSIYECIVHKSFFPVAGKYFSFYYDVRRFFSYLFFFTCFSTNLFVIHRYSNLLHLSRVYIYTRTRVSYWGDYDTWLCSYIIYNKCFEKNDIKFFFPFFFRDRLFVFRL